MSEVGVTLIMEKLGQLLMEDSRLLGPVAADVKELQIRMKRMLFLLKHADHTSFLQDSDTLGPLYSGLRVVAYDAEDVVDRFIRSMGRGGFTKFPRILVDSRRVRIAIRGFHQRIDELSSFKKLPRKLVDSRRARIAIRGFHQRIDELSSRCKGIKFDPIREEEERMVYVADDGDIDEEEEDEGKFLGMEEDIKLLVSRLIEKTVSPRVVSIVGPKGMGKTTLAKKVYNHHHVKSHFDCFVWISVTQGCRKVDVLRQILEQTTSAPQDIRTVGLYERDVLKELYDKRYLVVLDNICNPLIFKDVEHGLPRGKIGSRLLPISERLVTDGMDVFCLEMRGLNVEDSWALFSSKVFPHSHAQDEAAAAHKNPSTNSISGEFQDLGKDITRKCEGNPLAVELLASLLASKSLLYWNEVSENSGSFLSSHKSFILDDILSLSYRDLPVHLKACFLYFALFPGNSDIPAKKLIRLWVAEGFVQMEEEEEEEKTLEQVAEKYLEELIRRSMVQGGQRSSTGMGFKTCRMHGLRQEFCISVAKEQEFCISVANERQVVRLRFDDQRFRRFGIHLPRITPFNSLSERNPSVRSLLYFPSVENEQDVSSTIDHFKLLRVLDLQDVVLRSKLLSPAIGKLFHLRYLGLRNVEIVQLPETIACLYNLYTLDLGCNNRSTTILLPSVIWKLKHLRHLLLRRYKAAETLRVDTLENLETVKHLIASDFLAAINSPTFCAMNNLRSLGLTEIKQSDVECLLKSTIIQSNRLVSLSLSLSSSESSFPSLGHLSQSHSLLKLFLNGPIQELVHSDNPCGFLPPNLSKLTLVESRLHQDPMPLLEKMPNLRVLRLRQNAYSGKAMVCSANGFPRLKLLQICSIVKLEEVLIEEGSMASLSNLQIKNSPNLHMIPDALVHLKKLKLLDIPQMPREFESGVQVKGVQFYRVKPIPSVTLHHTKPKFEGSNTVLSELYPLPQSTSEFEENPQTSGL